MTVAELVVKLNSDPSGMEKGFSSAVRSANRLASTMGDVGRTLSIAVTAPLALAGAAAVSAAADFDSLRRGMVAVTGSAAAANVQLERMKDVARLPGLGFREAIQGSIRLQAVGISAQNAERYLRAFGNAVATTGGGKNELDRITFQLGQLSAKGKVLAQDIRPIIEAAPVVGRAMQQAFGTVDTEAIQKAGITTADFLNRLVSQLETLPRVTGGAKNSFENLTDSIYRAKVAIGEALLPAVVPLIEGLAGVLENVNALNPNTVRWGIAIAGVAAVAGPLILVVSSLTSAVTALAAALSIGLLPLIIAGGPILIATAALSAFWAKNQLDALNAAAAADRYKASLIGLSEAQLLASRTALQLDLSGQQAQMRALLSSGRAFRARPINPRTGSLEGDARQIETPEMRKLGEAANANRANIVALDGALTILRATAARPIPNPLTLASTGADKLAGTLDRVNDALREFQELMRFRGVSSVDQLTDSLREKVEMVQTLGDRVDRLQDGITKLGSRAPQAAREMLAELNAQLKSARDELQNLADAWNASLKQRFAQAKFNVSLIANAQIGLPSSNPREGRIASMGRTIGEELGIKDFGQAVSDVGSMLGNLSAPASLAGVALAGLKEAAFQAGRVVSDAFAATAGRAGEFAGNVVSISQQMMKSGQSFAAAGPQALALAAAMEVASGFFTALQPTLQAITLPLRIFGEIMAIGVVPVLRILFPVIKGVAIVFSFLQEWIERIIGAIVGAVGGFVRAIGKIINAITPFANPGNPLVKAGEAMQKTARTFVDAADEMKRKRKELQDLDFDDALENTTRGLNKLTEAVINTVAGFKADRLRFNATSTGTGTGALSPVPPRFDPSGTTNNTGDTINVGSGAIQVHVYANEGEDSYAAFKRGLARDAKVNPALRATAATFGVA